MGLVEVVVLGFLEDYFGLVWDKQAAVILLLVLFLTNPLHINLKIIRKLAPQRQILRNKPPQLSQPFPIPLNGLPISQPGQIDKNFLSPRRDDKRMLA